MENNYTSLPRWLLHCGEKLKQLNNIFYGKLVKASSLRVIRFFQSLAIVLLLSFGLSANAQLGYFNFTGAASCPNLNNTVSAQPANAVVSALINTGLTCVSNDSAYIYTGWNTSSSIDLNQYHEYSITPNSGFLLTLSSIVFDHQVSLNNTPATTWHVRSSIDNFSSDINTGTSTADWQTSTINLPSGIFSNIGAVTFRLYITDMIGGVESWSMDNLSLNGAVNPIPSIPADPVSNSPQCISTGVTLTRTGTPPIGETWFWQTSATGTDLSNSASTLNVSAAGTYYIRARNDNSLIWSDGAGSTSVSFLADVSTPVFALGSSSAICQGSGTLTYTATANNASGITYSLDPVSIAGGNFIKANGQLVYDNTWSGTTIVTAMASGCNGPLTANHTVTVTPITGTPVFAIGSASTRCQGAGTITYSATASNSVTMTYSLDAFSMAAGNAINPVTGAVTYAAGWTGPSTITITATGCNGTFTANHTATTTATIGTPVFTLGASSTRCQGANSVAYSATSSNSTGITYSLNAASIAGGNTINALTGTVTYTAAWTGSSIITATATGCGGPKSAIHSVTITPSVGIPFYGLGSASTRCQNTGNIMYSAFAFNSTGLTYSLDAASLAGGCTIAPGTGSVNYAATWNGTSTITVSATGCNGPKTANHVVTITNNGTPIFLGGTNSSRCQGVATIVYPASTTGNSGVTYSLDVASSNAGNSINPTTGAVSFAANWIGTTVITSTATGCAGVKTATHTVTITPNGTPTFALGAVSSRLQGAGDVIYSATSNNGGIVTYSLDSASLAGGNTINASTGVVTYTAGWNNTTTITASVNGCNGTVTATHTVSINSTIVTKNLYLSDSAQTLDRIDPVATNDLTTASTATIGISGGSGVVSIDNNQSGAVNTGTTLTLSNFITGSATNRYMLVTVALTSSVNTITYGAQSLTKIGSMGIGKPRVEIWQLVNPNSGTANVIITTAASGSIKAGVVTFSGVNPLAPYRTPFVTNSGTNNGSPFVTSMNVPSGTGEMVCDVLATDVNVAINVNSGQTQLWGIKGPAGDMSGVSSTKAGAGNVNLSWTYGSAATSWLAAAVSVMPLPANIPSTTFTQATPMCASLNIKGGKTITVTNYVSVTSGTMPANPAITATLSYGATHIITLSNPTYNSIAGMLTWTGTTADDVLVPAGQAISLTVNSAQAGVGFTINYDSKTQPSRIDLPVSSYINIDSFGVYNAPYSGGSAVISGITGNNFYIRTKVSDPFGFSDINGVDLTITPPGTVIPATLVASIGCTRTYEYVWNTISPGGAYSIFARAREGYEGVVSALANTSFNFCTFCPPVAISDLATGKGGAPLQINVLSNDYDPNNNINPGTLSIVAQPRNGSAILASGKIVYLPNGNFAGKDTIVYQICDSTTPASLCGTGSIYVSIDSTQIDPCADASRSQLYYIPFPETNARTALLASQNAGLTISNLRTIISLKMPYPNMIITWDHWEDGYEANIINPQQSSTLVWGDGNPYNGIAPGYADDIIPVGGSIVLDNTIPCNPRIQANIFFDGRDKIFSSGQITMTEVTGEPGVIGVQCMKTNVSSVSDFGLSFTIPAGENFNSQDFKYTALFVRASKNNTVVNVDRDNNNVFDTTLTLNEGECLFVNGGVKSGASVASSEPVGVDVHFGGVDNYSSREVPIFPATWYSSLYYTPVPTTKSPDTAVVMLCNSLSRPLTINWSSGIPSSGTVVIPAEGVVRFPLAVSATAAYKFQNPGGEAFTAIEIVDSYSPGGGGNIGYDFDWSFNLIAVERLTPYATIAWAPGSTNGTRNDNPIWVTPLNNTTIYVKYDGNVLAGGLTSPCGMHYDASYPINVLTHKRIRNPGSKNDQSGIAIYTSDGTKLAAVYGEDPSTASIANPSWDVGTTIQPFCAQKIILANDDLAYTMTGKPVTIDVLDNDTSFLCTLNPMSVTNTGYLQPKYGTATVNTNGTILYMPKTGYIGNDTLEYSICSSPAPGGVVCDVAQVIVIINSCPTPNSKNIISGQVFLDRSKDGINNDGGTGFNGAKIYLYVDGNCNGTPSATELIDSVIADASGTYQFLTYPELTVEDDFDGVAGVSSCNSGSDGTASWASNWVDAGDGSSPNFCFTPIQSFSNTNAELFKDYVSGNFAVRLKKPNVSITRTLNLSGATAAYLTFSYRRAGAIAVGRDVLVQASSGGAFTTIYTISGSGVSDAAYTNVYYQNLLPYASATTSIRFLTNAGYGNADTIFIDNISITYLKYPQCYITKVDTTSLPLNYSFTTALQNAFSLNSGGVCATAFDFGLAKSNITVGGTVYNDANGLTDNLVNGTPFGLPGGATLYVYLVDSTNTISYKTTVNSATGVYSFPQADVTTAYNVVISAADSALYTKAPISAYLPSGWVSTGDNYGTNNTSGTGNEAGLPNLSIALKTGFVNVSGVNFGIQALPVAGSGINSAINPGGSNNVPIPASTFTKTKSGSDSSPGFITAVRIYAFPSNATSMTINGTIYTPGNFPFGGLIVPASPTGEPMQLIEVDPLDNVMRVPIIYYVIDNANKESLLPGTATLQLLNDFDRDGLSDTNDIDDDNDGIPDFVEVCGSGATSFGCLAGGSDPGGDDDNDDIVNYRDPDFGTLNSAGCVAILDKDGDGLPDYLDLDSDNDGIPDVVEAGGVDTNGDGIIDNFSDIDVDGLSQNVDASNTGQAGSGLGLGFADFDSDGIPNTIDLDSDNDGIPDIIEAGGTDTDNDGRVDGYLDLNYNGLSDAYEPGGAILITGTDMNGDGRADSYPNANADKAGRPNPYDLDSDDDGIVDAIEAGFPFNIIVSNGKVTGPSINGWAIDIQSLVNIGLANTDNGGPPNYLDVDSDDDGISDNIEGQSTLSYVLPSDADTDGDGLNNTYDISPNAFGGNGITPFDFDSDGLPDYVDIDADNDGAFDINEASKMFNLNYTNLILTDTDSDGMVDQFDILNNNSLADGSHYKNVTNSQMGPGGSWNGPMPSGSNVQLVRSNPSGDLDLRTQLVLPKKVLSLSGKFHQQVSNLIWHVEGEETTAYYLVERSMDGIAFSPVATVLSTRQVKADYAYGDHVNGILDGMVYYRIIQVDVNGNKVKSNIVRFSTEEIPSMVLKAYPNPVDDRITLSVYSPVKDMIKVSILDVNGKTVKDKSFQLKKGDNSFEFSDLKNLSKGVYIIKAIIKDVYLIRFVKQ